MLHDLCSYVCPTAVSSPLPLPGPSVTRGPVHLKGNNVTLTMYTIYDQRECYFRVCLYNKLNCCYCDSSVTCKWGELSGNTNPESGNNSCQLTTSQPDLYQFQIHTSNYPCFFDIDEPIDVVDDSVSSSHDQISPLIIGGCCLAGFLLAVALFVIVCVVHKHRKHQHQHARLGKLCT